MVFRLNIGGRPAETPSSSVQYVAGWQELEDDPFGSQGPVQAEGGTGQGGADPNAAWQSLEFDPFGDGGAAPQMPPPAATTRGAGDTSMLGALTGTQPREYLTGGAGAGMPDATALPAPDARRSEEQLTVSNPQVPWWEALTPLPTMRGPTWDPTFYSAPGGPTQDLPPNPAQLQFTPPQGLLDPPSAVPDTRLPNYTPSGPEPQPGIYARAMAEPLGTGATPDLQPPQANRGDGTTVGMPAPGSVSFDPNQGDVFGGHASNTALMLASLVPLTSQENLEKRISIYADDLGVPKDRFFTDADSNIKYVDFRGQTFNVAPTVAGGTIRAPVDLARRVATQGAAEFGQGAVMAAGGAAALISGPENYGPAAMGAAFLGSGVADIGRQMLGNAAALKAGHIRDPRLDPPKYGEVADIDWLNVLGQGVQNATFEGFARLVPALMSRMAAPGLGANPYKLSPQQSQDLARVLEDDVKRGGTILKRAQVANELGLPLTPADLLTVSRGVGGASADTLSMRGRLYESLSQLENSVAHAGGRNGAPARQWMRQYYVHRARDQFPQAVGRLVERISPVESPTLGFQQFRQAADTVLSSLEQRRLEAGHRQGWGSLFQSPAILANPTPVINLVDQRLKHAAGPIRKELESVRDELVERATYTQGGKTTAGAEPVTDFQRLHQVRLGLMRRIDELRVPGSSSAERTELLNELEGIHDLLRSQLTANPLYNTGDRAFMEASAGLNDARHGILSLLRAEPRIQERLGGPLADSGPTTIRAARQLFEEAGQGAAWDAHTRAYLETHLRNAGKGYDSGLSFANEVASQPKLHAGLMEMVRTERERDLLDGLIDAGFAIDQRAKGLADVSREAMRPDSRRLNPTGSNVLGMAAGVLSPISGMRNQLLKGQNYLNTRGAESQAVRLSMPAGTSYQNMADTTVPLAGRRGEIFERMLYGTAPAFAAATDLIPRASPTWVAGQTLPTLMPPPERSATAPDLLPPAAQRRAAGLLGW